MLQAPTTMNAFNLIRKYRDPWTDREIVYFAIIHTPRSGSNFLAELLDSSERITCHSEIFSPKSTYLSRQEEAPYIDKQTRDSDPWTFLCDLIGCAQRAKAFGFKIGLYDCRSMLLYVLFSRRVKKLVIRRRNVLAAFLSSERANQTGQWIQWRDCLAEDHTYSKIHVSTLKFSLYSLKLWMFYALVRLVEVMTGQRFLWLHYEDLMKSSDLGNVVKFLRLKQVGHLSPRTARQNKYPVREQIKNLDFVERFMRCVRSDWMLSE